MNNCNNFLSLDITEKDLSQQDIKVLYEYVERRDEGEPGFRASITSMYERNARWSNPIIRLAVSSASLVLTPRNRSVKYIFWGTKFKEIILGLPRHEVCVIGGPKQLMFCLRHHIPFLANMQMWKALALGLKHKTCSGEGLKKIIIQSGHKLKKKASPGATLIVDNDSLPMQRAFILSGRLAQLKSACIQDGIFQSKSPGHIMHGWMADQMLAINKHQKEMLISKGMDAHKIKVMGFHSSPYQPKRPTSPAGQRLICFLGQPWTKYEVKRGERYLEIVERVKMTLHEAGIEMTYKPHPWEKGSDHLKHIRNVVDIKLNDALENYDVFISLTSTALIEAQAAGRLAIQIMDEAFDADDLSVHGNITTIKSYPTCRWTEELSEALHAPSAMIARTQPAHIRLKKALED